MTADPQCDVLGAMLSTTVPVLVTSAPCTRASAPCEHDWQGLLAALCSRYKLLERASAFGSCSGSINNETAAVICCASGAKCEDPRRLGRYKDYAMSVVSTVH